MLTLEVLLERTIVLNKCLFLSLIFLFDDLLCFFDFTHFSLQILDRSICVLLLPSDIFKLSFQALLTSRMLLHLFV